MMKDRVLMKNVTDFNFIKNVCCYCGEKIDDGKKKTIEHLIPKSNGGNNRSENKKVCCKGCNNGRSNLDYDDWIIKLKKRRAFLFGFPGNYNSIKKIDTIIENIKYWQSNI